MNSITDEEFPPGAVRESDGYRTHASKELGWMRVAAMMQWRIADNLVKGGAGAPVEAPNGDLRWMDLISTVNLHR
jgi:hypothetical protein